MPAPYPPDGKSVGSDNPLGTHESDLDVKVAECLRRVTEAQLCMRQAALAEQMLAEARRALEGMMLDNRQGKQHEWLKDKAAAQGFGRPAVPDQAENGIALAENTEPVPPASGSNAERSPRHWPARRNSYLSTSSLSVQRNGLLEPVKRVDEDLKSCAASLARSLGISEREVVRCYDCFYRGDRDKSGKVSTEELKSILTEAQLAPVPDEDYEEILRHFDKDEDGSLDFEEFIYLYCALPARRAETLKARLYNYNGDDPIGHDVRAKIVGVPTYQVHEYLKKEMDEEKGFLHIPIVWAILISFVIALNLHWRTSLLHASESALKYDIIENANFAFSGAFPFENGRMGHKGLEDVNTFADFWSFFDLGLVPLFFPEGWDVSETRSNTLARCANATEALLDAGWDPGIVKDLSTPSILGPYCPETSQELEYNMYSEYTPYLFYHSILGGVRLRQERAQMTDCNYRRPGDPGKCSGSAFAYALQPELDTEFDIDQSKVNQYGGETVYMLSTSSRRDVRQQIRALENRAWLDQSSTKVEILITLYNPHQDTFTALSVMFYLNAAGHFFKVLRPISIWLDPYHGEFLCYFLDIIWLMLVGDAIFEEARDLVSRIRTRGARRGLQDYVLCIHTWVDCGTAIYGIVIMSMWLRHLQDLEILRDFIMKSDPSVLGSWVSDSERLNFYDHADKLISRDNEFRRVTSLYPLGIGCRIFSAFSFQPRLAMVTSTVWNAMPDLIHFGLVFSSVFLVYSASGMFLFGRDLAEFSTFSRATFSTFRMLFGELPWEEMSPMGRDLVVPWCWSFMLIMPILMMNMLLAIVLEVWADVKSRTSGGHVETIWSQTYEIFRRWKQRVWDKDRVSVKHICRVLSASLDDAKESQAQYLHLLTVCQFVDAVPCLERPQALRILRQCLVHFEEERRPRWSLNDTVQYMKMLQRRVEHVQANMDRVILRQIHASATLDALDASAFAAKVTAGVCTSKPADKDRGEGPGRKHGRKEGSPRPPTRLWPPDCGGDVGHGSDGRTMICCAPTREERPPAIRA